MANEKRLIDASVLIRDLTAMKSVYDAIALNGIIKALKEAPTVDAVELPCKLGDRVWAIRNFRGVLVPQEGIVSEMFFCGDMRLCIVVKHIARGEWGKTVFATKEETEAQIAKMDGGNDGGK